LESIAETEPKLQPALLELVRNYFPGRLHGLDSGVFFFRRQRQSDINGPQMTDRNSLKIVMILLAFGAACFAEDKALPIEIDCTFNNADPVKLRLHGFSNTKVAPEKIAVWHYSRPEFNPRIKATPNYIIVGTGFGHVTKQTNRAELGAKLRKVASDHGANVIAYEISGTEFRVQFVRVRDDVFKEGSPQRDAKRSQ
jgi:hypothetical protein